ncbi:MAG: hypothetical protein QM725_07215 [Lacibacter sp.]|nr:hypothetical protein [Ferruginibacter sp.]HMP20287.1 hypothetical protein [Ferruginibacter sp.]
MLQSISWSQYLTSLILLLVCYYVYVGYKFYSWELLNLVGIKKIEPGVADIPIEEFKAKLVSENHAAYLPKETVDGANVLQSIKDEITAYLIATVDSIPSKNELLNALQVIIAKYPAKNLSGNNNSLHQFILAETEAIHPGVITQDDLPVIFSV